MKGLKKSLAGMVGAVSMSALSLLGATGCNRSSEAESRYDALVQKATDDENRTFIAERDDNDKGYFSRKYNVLFTPYEYVIDFVSRNYQKMGIADSMTEAFARLSKRGAMEENSSAYNEVPMFVYNYAPKKESAQNMDFQSWEKFYRSAAQESEKICKEGLHKVGVVPKQFGKSFYRKYLQNGGTAYRPVNPTGPVKKPIYKFDHVNEGR